jgi:hypothetical protein
MKCTEAIRCIVIFMVISLFGVQHVSAQTPPSGGATTLDLVGTLTSPDGKPIPNGMVTIEHDTTTVRKAVSNKDGQFRIQAVSPGSANITFEAPGYNTIEELGVKLVEDTDLSRTLQEKSVGGWWLMFLLIPAVFGLGVAALKERKQGERKKVVPKKGTAGAEKDVQPPPQGQEAGGGGSVSKSQSDTNKFDVAVANGLIWLITMGFLAWMGSLGSHGVYKLQLFHPSLSFDFYVPILGFIGSLLYVLDLFRRSGKDFPKGTEFGMRLIMGPYVAIVMVVLFGNDLGLVDLTSPIAKGTIALFSGLLVVVALQGLTEKGNELLGQWRQKSRYEKSEIAERFGLSEEEDLTLRKAGLRLLAYLRERDDEALKADVRRVGFDENLAASLKKQLEKEQLEKAIGGLAWERLKGMHVNTVEDLANVERAVLEEIAGRDPKLSSTNLVAFRDQARELCKP